MDQRRIGLNFTTEPINCIDDCERVLWGDKTRFYINACDRNVRAFFTKPSEL